MCPTWVVAAHVTQKTVELGYATGIGLRAVYMQQFDFELRGLDLRHPPILIHILDRDRVRWSRKAATLPMPRLYRWIIPLTPAEPLASI